MLFAKPVPDPDKYESDLVLYKITWDNKGFRLKFSQNKPYAKTYAKMALLAEFQPELLHVMTHKTVPWINDRL